MTRFSVFFLLAMMACPSVFALTVPDDDCPANWGPEAGPAECSYVHTCTRSDSGASITDPGTPDVTLGAELVCDNCDPGCPETEPPPLSCTEALTVTYTESLSASISSEIGVDAGITATLGSTIGAEEGRQLSAEVTCGSGAFSPCKKGSYKSKMNVYLNVKAEITHTYSWVCTKVSGPASCNGEHTDPGGETKSTATANKGSNTATCAWGGYQDC